MNISDMTHLKKDNTVIITGAIALTALAFQLFSLYRSPQEKEGTKVIPTPKNSYPYIGHLFSFGEDPTKQIKKWHEELGDIYQLKMGVQRWIMISSPALAHQIFVQNGAHSSLRHSTVFTDTYSFNGKGLVFAKPDSGWRNARAAVLSVLAPKVVDSYTGLIEKESATLVDRLIEATEKDKGVDPRELLNLYALSVLCQICVGKTFTSVDDKDFKNIYDMLTTGGEFISPDNNLPNFLPIISFIYRFNGTYIAMRKHLEEKQRPIVRELLKEATLKGDSNIIKEFEGKGYAFDEEDKMCIISDLLGAGTDTVSVSNLWIFAILCNKPDVQVTICAEIDEFIKVNGRIPSFTDRNEVPMCFSVIRECMRYRTPAPLGVGHKTDKDLDIDGYKIPKNSILISTTEVMHQSAFYSDPDTFIPERFISNDKTMFASANGKLNERDHFNFGWGRRICPGMHLAEVELFSTFINVFSRCSIEPELNSEGSAIYPDLMNPIFKGLTTSPVAYKIRFIKRKDVLV